ncbi:DUF4395 family protein [Pedobacter petrophilus]|uniref:DUF4395 family protein n=1 Tax=Pedobacter petrophilus TaxID=1908241 RepID=A0A7K0FUL6_9SPHI|nr:DUF4395 domain-containing protein [Pedobacter petrophilus]MRX75278.1 DUF4395 family protein [Pedobacter petrophilus]
MEISCPISAERVNENVIRIIAFMVALIAISCLISSNYWAIILLLVDFAARAFGSGNFSLLKLLALQIAKILALKPQMKDLAPKKFAATLGFGFSLLITAMFLFNFSIMAMALTSVMTIFALLESLFAVCVGCYVYSFIQTFKE